MKATSRTRRRMKSPKMARKHVVWASLLASMTAVGGVLLILDSDRGAPGGIPLASLENAARGSSLDAIFNTSADLDSSRWHGIVIHHSGSPAGSAETITKDHDSKGLKGLGYHFVVSNGQGAPDGQIFVGYRWQQQLPGAHVIGPRAETFNRETIGICLVGNGERRPFTAAQMSSLSELVAALQAKLDIPDSAVVLHRAVAPTSDPGRHFSEMALRQMLADRR